MFSRNEKYAYEKGYRVTFDGDMINPEGKKVGYYNSNGYLMHKIRFGPNKEGKHKKFLVSRLQAYQKYGEDIYKKGIVVRHLNGNKIDNSHNNISIGTQSQNMLDRPVEERKKHAMKATKAMMKYKNVDEIIKYHEENGQSYKKTMNKFGISSKGTLHYILNNRNKNK